MFGGIAFLIAGNMAVGVHEDELMVRVGTDAHDDAVALPGARIVDLSASGGWCVLVRAIVGVVVVFVSGCSLLWFDACYLDARWCVIDVTALPTATSYAEYVLRV